MALVKAWTTPTEIGATQAMAASLFNTEVMQNLLYLLNKPYDEVVHTGGSNWTTTSTVPVKVDSSRYQVQLNTQSGEVEIYGTLQLTVPANAYIRVGILIDDDYLLGDPAGVGGNSVQALGTFYGEGVETVKSWTFSHKVHGLSVGLHQFEPQVWVSSGTGGVQQITFNTNIFGVREI